MLISGNQAVYKKKLNSLLIISHVLHYQYQGKLYAYGPYAREIELWADLFSEVVIASPLHKEAPPGDCVPFNNKNISIIPQPERGGDGLRDKIWQIISLPYMVFSLCKAMSHTDAIHVRCPGNLGLLGVLLAPLFSRFRIAKYAGQWNGYFGENFATRLQRRILSSSWWNAPVTVYGCWPDQPDQIVPFFTSMMSQEQTKFANQYAQKRKIENPLKILFSGRLSDVKRVDVLINAYSQFVKNHQDAELILLGDGPKREELESLARKLNLSNRIRFLGALPYDQALEWYKWADCLVLPSKHSEGWPKVIAEAMCYGVFCIAVSHGQVPFMLEERGTLLQQGSSEEIAQALSDVADHREVKLEIAQTASDWSSHYSLESLRSALADLIEKSWNIKLTNRHINDE